MMKFKVKIVTTGQHSAEVEALLNQLYVNMYNEFSNFVNPRYERWNKEYDEISGNDSEGEVDQQAYNQFIIKKYQHIFKTLHSKYRDVVKDVFAGDDCDFRVRWFDDSVSGMLLEDHK